MPKTNKQQRRERTNVGALELYTAFDLVPAESGQNHIVHYN
jgi:hypothetical protein